MRPIFRMANRLKAQLAKIDTRFQDREVVAESAVWIAAWLLIPLHLAREGIDTPTLAIYVCGASLLVSLGVLATTPEPMGGWRNFLCQIVRCCLALLLAGGTVFLLASCSRPEG